MRPLLRLSVLVAFTTTLLARLPAADAPAEAKPKPDAASAEQINKARELLRQTQVPTNAKTNATATNAASQPIAISGGTFEVKPGTPITDPAQARAAALAAAAEEARKIAEERKKANDAALVDLVRSQEAKALADAERQKEIQRIENAILKAAEDRKQKALEAASAPASPRSNFIAPAGAGTPQLSPEAEAKARALLQQTATELGRAVPVPPAAPATATVIPTPPPVTVVTVPPPAPAPAAAPTVVTLVPVPSAPTAPRGAAAPALRPAPGSAPSIAGPTSDATVIKPAPSEKERKEMARRAAREDEAREAAEEKRQREQRKLEARRQAEMNAAAKAAGSAPTAAARKAELSQARRPAPVAIATEPVVDRSSLTPRQRKLAELLDAYRRAENPISPEEYHRERARILAEPQ